MGISVKSSNYSVKLFEIVEFSKLPNFRYCWIPEILVIMHHTVQLGIYFQCSNVGNNEHSHTHTFNRHKHTPTHIFNRHKHAHLINTKNAFNRHKHTHFIRHKKVFNRHKHTHFTETNKYTYFIRHKKHI